MATKNYKGFNVYKNSIHRSGSIEVFMAADNGGNFIISDKAAGFSGIAVDGGKVRSELNHENAQVLRRFFPWAAPSPVLRKERSFGLGDRLGIATTGHIDVFKHYDAYPVFAQQSIRELALTGRSYEEVLDAATFAVFRENFQKEWGADGDHLKTVKDIEYALSLGFTMITLDCSEHIKSGITPRNASQAAAAYREKYLGKKFDLGEGLVLEISTAELNQAVAIYSQAINFIIDIYNKFFVNAGNKADFEISIDETSEPTTPIQHFFVAKELVDAGVSFATIAPRFCGEFQKGIDYKGNLNQFSQELHAHAIIARHFKYKLSIHSGSDKFSVFTSIADETRGIFHVKTAGTNWLEAMCVVSELDADLYRNVHKYALEVFNEAAAYYHVTTDLSRIPDADTLDDEDMPSLFTNNDVRQLIHITYGLILCAKNADGSFRFRDKLYKLWIDNEGAYKNALIKHISKHLNLLKVNKN
ncbi:hypothetical protein FACS189450_00670 [Spirochaetia bacterium]|nr:hypothetical protein FACS189450_00670 [Spirochaetia bacterium]